MAPDPGSLIWIRNTDSLISFKQGWQKLGFVLKTTELGVFFLGGGGFIEQEKAPDQGSATVHWQNNGFQILNELHYIDVLASHAVCRGENK
jgi:hypothetical protein